MTKKREEMEESGCHKKAESEDGGPGGRGDSEPGPPIPPPDDP